MCQSKRLPVQTPTVWTVIGPMDLYVSDQYQCTKPAVTFLKTLGISISIYIGNLLVMAPRKDLPQEHTEYLMFLLENLGFTVNRQKSLTDPTGEIDVLGLVADSFMTELRLSGSKNQNILSDAKALLLFQPTARNGKTAWLVDTCTREMRAGPFFFRHLQTSLQSALQPLRGLLQTLPSQRVFWTKASLIH